MVWHSPARPIAGRAQLRRIYRTGGAYDLGYVYVEVSGITIGVRLDPDGGAKVPHGGMV